MPPQRKLRPVRDYGVVDIGFFKADVKKVGELWMFRPYYTDNPKHGPTIEMNAMIRSMGRIWTAVPEEEIDKLKKVLGVI